LVWSGLLICKIRNNYEMKVEEVEEVEKDENHSFSHSF